MRRDRAFLSSSLFLAVAAAGAMPLAAAVDGTVINGTTGQPQPGVIMTLIQPTQQGMQNLGTIKTDAAGKFVFPKDSPGGPQLLQTIYKGVIYNQMIPPGTPSTGVAVKIFESTKTPEAAEIAQHMIVVEPSETQMNISEAFILNNKTTTTFANSTLGGIRFYLPPGAQPDSVHATVKASGGMPVTRDAEKTETPNVYKVDYPIKPGETEFDITYSMPASEKYEGKIVGIKGQPASPLRLVAPVGVTLEGAGLKRLGQEPSSQATIFDVTATAAYAVKVQGTGSLRGSQDANSNSDGDSPPVVAAAPQIYHFLWYLIAAGLGALAVGFAILYRTSPVRQDS